MTSTLAIFAALFAVKALYAYILEKRLRQLEPDYTWWLVFIGVGICVVAAGIDRRLNGPLTADQTELRIVIAMLWGGIPIGIWQAWKKHDAWRRVFQRIFEGTITHGDETDHAEAMAEECRAEPDAGN